MLSVAAVAELFLLERITKHEMTRSITIDNLLKYYQHGSAGNEYGAEDRLPA